MPDGKRIVTGAWGHAPQLWDLPAGKRLHEFDGPKQSNTLRLSPDGKYLVASTWRSHDDETRDFAAFLLWDVAGSKFRGSVGPVYARGLQYHLYPAWLADGSLVFGDDYGIVRTWDVMANEVKRELCKNGTTNLAVSPDGKLLVIYYRGLAFYDLASGKLLGRTTEPPSRNIHWDCPLAFSADARWLAVGDHYNGEIVLCDTTSFRIRRRFNGHQGCVRGFAFSPDGKTLASAGEDTTVMLWDVAAPGPQGWSSADAWANLAVEDETHGFDAVCTLLGAPAEALALLKDRQPALRPVGADRVRALVADLANDKFAVREKAAQQLELLQESAVPELERALAGKPGLEVQQRIERLLSRVAPGKLAAGSLRLRWLRAVEVLERIGTPQARAQLEELAGGAEEVQIVREARAALKRLEAGASR